MALIVIPAFLIGRKIRNIKRIPSLQLVSSPNNCVSCHTCTNECPMSLPVEKMVKENLMENVECVLCGTCIDGCKSQAIKFNFGNNGKMKN